MKKLFILAAATMALTACDNDNNLIDEPIEARISASIAGSALSRANETSWAEGDDIGLTMVGRYNNYKYTTADASGAFDGTTMYFRNKRDPETLIAYYPFAGTQGTIPELIEASTASARQTKEEQAKYDFLYATKENVTGSDPAVKLDFSHKMSKLTFKFKDGNNGTDVSLITSYTISGLVLEGTFNPTTGACAAKSGTPTGILDIATSVQHDVLLPPLIVFPQDVEKVTMRIFDSEEQEYSCELKFTDNRLESGNNYLYTIVVKKTGLNVEQSSINDWTENAGAFFGESE